MTSEDETRPPASAEDATDGATAARTDEAETDASKSYVTILDQEIQEGVDELERPARGLLLSGLSAGLDVGFSVLAIGAAESLLPADAGDFVRGMVRANAYALGFILVIFGRSDLFTEHTTLAVLPLLDGRTTVGRVGRVWALIYVGNLVGVTIFSVVLALAGPALGSVDPQVLAHLADHLLYHPWWVIVLSAVLAGWLMGLVSWLVTAGRDTTSQILFVWMVTGLIGLASLHHSILGSAEVLSALLTGAPITAATAGTFLLLSTLGNALGGFFFVAIVKYGHASVVRPGLRDPLRWECGDQRD